MEESTLSSECTGNEHSYSNNSTLRLNIVLVNPNSPPVNLNSPPVSLNSMLASLNSMLASVNSMLVSYPK